MADLIHGAMEGKAFDSSSLLRVSSDQAPRRPCGGAAAPELDAEVELVDGPYGQFSVLIDGETVVDGGAWAALGILPSGRRWSRPSGATRRLVADVRQRRIIAVLVGVSEPPAAMTHVEAAPCPSSKVSSAISRPMP